MPDDTNAPTTQTNADAAPIAPLLLSLPQAAEALGVCARTLWGLARRGEVPSVRLGRRRLFDPRDLSAWIDRAKEAPDDDEGE